MINTNNKFSKTSARIQFKNILSDFPNLLARINNNPQKQYFFDKLNLASTVTSSCYHLSDYGFIFPINVLSRTLFEIMITLYWASLDTDNSVSLLESEKKEFHRIIRKNLTEGTGKIINTITNEDVTKCFLKNERMKNARRFPSIESLAKNAKIKNIYDIFYTILSCSTHANIYKFGYKEMIDISDEMTTTGTNQMVDAVLSFVNACFFAIFVISKNYIIDEKPISHSELEKLLGVELH